MSSTITTDLIQWHMNHANTARNKGWRLELFADRRHNFIQIKANDGGPFVDDGQAWLHILGSDEPQHLAALKILKRHCEPELVNMLTYASRRRAELAHNASQHRNNSVCTAA